MGHHSIHDATVWYEAEVLASAFFAFLAPEWRCEEHRRDGR